LFETTEKNISVFPTSHLRLRDVVRLHGLIWDA